MKIILNGEEREIQAKNIAELVVELKLENARVAAERNKELVRRAEYEATSLSEGDHVEIVTLVGGG